MKEMRLLRDLRHDNINSFIGACVEPMRILLVTDYCAKGSLYDIIENEDIKLDDLFIASLVHDLIKVSTSAATAPERQFASVHLFFRRLNYTESISNICYWQIRKNLFPRKS
jgi:serine/threonine protein kinase